MIKIALYRGTSIISKIIRWQTRSVYSHAAAILDDGSVIEAWHRGGVSHVNNLLTNHTPKTEIDIFLVYSSKKQEEGFYKFLLNQVGKKYDFQSVIRFINRKSANSNEKWFCSELVYSGLVRQGINPLLRISASEVSPKLLSISPELIFNNKYINF